MEESYLVHGMAYNFIHKKCETVTRRISELIGTEEVWLIKLFR
jgi:hypothetical protein